MENTEDSLSSATSPSSCTSPSLLSSPSSLDLTINSQPGVDNMFEASDNLKCSFRDSKFSVYLFCIFASRLLIYPLWTIENIPILSPVYWQGHHWSSSSARTLAILFHISFGVVMLCAGIHQLQRDVVSVESVSASSPSSFPSSSLDIPENFPAHSVLRSRRYARWHKAVGRIYVVSGLIVLISLQILLPTMGRGISEGPNYAVIAMMETSAVLWVGAVIGGIFTVWRGRNLIIHRRLMRFSYAVALTPMTQRFVHVALVPMALLLVSLVCTIEGTYTWPNTTDDVWSMSGYGRADEGMLPVSAWMGLLINIGLFALDDRKRLRAASVVNPE